jgi:hypothetical protein
MKRENTVSAGPRPVSQNLPFVRELGCLLPKEYSLSGPAA